MQALYSLGPTKNEWSCFPSHLGSDSGRWAPVLAGSSKALIAASSSSATHFLCISFSLLHLLNNDIWPRDGTQRPKKLQLFQIRLNQCTFWIKQAIFCLFCFARQAAALPQSLFPLFSPFLRAYVGHQTGLEHRNVNLHFRWPWDIVGKMTILYILYIYTKADLKIPNLTPVSLLWNGSLKLYPIWKSNWDNWWSQISFNKWTKVLCSAFQSVLLKQPQSSVRISLFIYLSPVNVPLVWNHA